MASPGRAPAYHGCMSPAEPPLHPDACYLALKARDARFDGSFFTGVTSTGIYCRPVCKVRTPRRENCRFFAHAAQADPSDSTAHLISRSSMVSHAKRRLRRRRAEGLRGDDVAPP